MILFWQKFLVIIFHSFTGIRFSCSFPVSFLIYLLFSILLYILYLLQSFLFLLASFLSFYLFLSPITIFLLEFLDYLSISSCFFVLIHFGYAAFFRFTSASGSDVHHTLLLLFFTFSTHSRAFNAAWWIVDLMRLYVFSIVIHHLLI